MAHNNDNDMIIRFTRQGGPKGTFVASTNGVLTWVRLERNGSGWMATHAEAQTKAWGKTREEAAKEMFAAHPELVR